MSAGCIDTKQLKNLQKDQTPEQRKQAEKALLSVVDQFQRDPQLAKFKYNAMGF